MKKLFTALAITASLLAPSQAKASANEAYCEFANYMVLENQKELTSISYEFIAAIERDGYSAANQTYRPILERTARESNGLFTDRYKESCPNRYQPLIFNYNSMPDNPYKASLSQYMTNISILIRLQKEHKINQYFAQ